MHLLTHTHTKRIIYCIYLVYNSRLIHICICCSICTYMQTYIQLHTHPHTFIDIMHVGIPLCCSFAVVGPHQRHTAALLLRKQLRRAAFVRSPCLYSKGRFRISQVQVHSVIPSSVYILVFVFAPK